MHQVPNSLAGSAIHCTYQWLCWAARGTDTSDLLYLLQQEQLCLFTGHSLKHSTEEAWVNGTIKPQVPHCSRSAPHTTWAQLALSPCDVRPAALCAQCWLEGPTISWAPAMCNVCHAWASSNCQGRGCNSLKGHILRKNVETASGVVLLT